MYIVVCEGMDGGVGVGVSDFQGVREGLVV